MQNFQEKIASRKGQKGLIYKGLPTTMVDFGSVPTLSGLRQAGDTISHSWLMQKEKPPGVGGLIFFDAINHVSCFALLSRRLSGYIYPVSS